MTEEANRRETADPGWYPDPSQPGQERLWTGESWSKSTRPQDPVRLETNPAAWHSDPSVPDRERLWSGESWTDHTRPLRPAAVAHDPANPSSKPPPGIAEQPRPVSEPVERPEAKSLTTLGRVVTVPLGLTIVANLGSILANYEYVHYVNEILGGGQPAHSQVKHAVDTMQAAETTYWVTLALAGVVFIWWFHRAYRNLAARGLADLRYGSGWAIGGWLVPILSLARPKAIANDIWKGSAAIAGAQRNRWSKLPIPSLLNWWWGCWIGGSLFARLAVYWSGSENPSELSLRHVLHQERVSGYLHELGSLVLIIAAVLAIVLVRRVSAMQDGSTEPQPGISPQAIEPARAPLA